MHLSCQVLSISLDMYCCCCCYHHYYYYYYYYWGNEIEFYVIWCIQHYRLLRMIPCCCSPVEVRMIMFSQ